MCQLALKVQSHLTAEETLPDAAEVRVRHRLMAEYLRVYGNGRPAQGHSAAKPSLQRFCCRQVGDALDRNGVGGGN